MAYNSPLWKFFPLQTVNVAHFQIRIQLSGFSAYPDGSPSQLIHVVSGVILYLGLYCYCLPNFIKSGMDKCTSKDF